MKKSEKLAVKFMKAGRTYLIKESSATHSFEIFFEAIRQGKEGLCISREHPDEIRERYDVRNTRVYWLTSRGENDFCMNPLDLVRIERVIREFSEKRDTGIILLDGLEFLSVHNGYNNMLKFVHRAKDLVAENKSILILPINPESFGQRELSLLERDIRSRWYESDWREIKSTTWRDVFSLQRPLLYVPLLVAVIVNFFLTFVLILLVTGKL
jgi:hypothetical protein